MKDELIHVACFIQEPPLENKNDLITLRAEAWRDKNTKKSHFVKIAMQTDLYLDCLSAIQNEEKEVSLYFTTIDEWKALKKVFKQPDFAFYLTEGFELIVEEEEDFKLVKEF